MTSDLLQDSAPSFHTLGISQQLLGVLDRIGYSTPTPIQQQAITPGIEGKDIVGIAQTGTGKTLAFGIPMIERVLKTEGKGLVLAPTRELAAQIQESFEKIGAPLGIRTTMLIGGASMGPQIASLRRNPHVVIATPGRLIDHLEQDTIRLGKVAMLVLDEADRMLDMGFLPQIKKILDQVPQERQTMLFSATLSHEILTIAQKAMKIPLQIEVAPQGTTSERITQELFLVRKEDKVRLLEKVLIDHSGSTLVFARTKHGATKITKKIQAMGFHAAEIHSNRSLSQRKMALDGFKSGKYRVLVATDIVARGIDVKDVALVINYDLPDQSADYVHRIGRTARAGADGHAISFVEPNQKRDIRDIERLIRKSLEIKPLPDGLPEPAPYHESSAAYEKSERSFRSRGQNFRPHRSHNSHASSRSSSRGSSRSSSRTAPFRRRSSR